MKNGEITSGYTQNGLPYYRLSGGPRVFVIFEGLNFVHKPLSGFSLKMMSRGYNSFTPYYTVYYVGRKPGLPQNYSIRDMSGDYAVMIENEIKTQVDIMGLSTGGPMAMQFAVDHSDLVRHLVLASTGYRLSDNGAEVQRKVIEMVQKNKWRDASAALAGGMTSGILKKLFVPVAWMMGSGFFGGADNPSDGLVELEAEDKFNFKDRLSEIKIPTLVIGGEKDRLYPIRETAAGITGAQLILYKNSGHMASMKSRYNRDILQFLIKE